MDAFLPIAILLFLAVGVCAGILIISSLLGPKTAFSPNKLSVYECGAPPEGGARTPYRSRFYLIAVLFLILDVEGAFFFPWALVYRDSLKEGPQLLIAFFLYLAFLVLGLAYLLRKNALGLDLE